MKIAVIGGTGAMGSLYGAYLHRAGHTVTLFDVSREHVDAINRNGLEIREEDGSVWISPVKATTSAASVGSVDLAIVFVKGQHTAAAIHDARPMIAPHTAILTLQNGWGNVDRIAEVAQRENILAGISLNSVTLLGPGKIHRAGHGPTHLGELDGRMTERLKSIAEALTGAGFEVEVTGEIVRIIWSKLALNACALPECALLRWRSGQLTEHEPTLELMRAVLKEVVAVANAQGIPLDFEERWSGIHAQLLRASQVRCSMLQDVERGRKTEIETITGAVVREGLRLGVPTPHNQTLLWMIRGLDSDLDRSGSNHTHG